MTILSARRRARMKTLPFWGNIIWAIIRAVILIGLCFLIVYPLILKIVTCFMSPRDLINPTVKLFPREVSFEILQTAFKGLNYWTSLRNTFLLSLTVSIVQILVSAVAGYGLARFKFRGKGLIFVGIILALLVPPQTITLPLFVQFAGYGLVGTLWPFVLLSLTGLGLKNGLYIYMMQQHFRGLPGELEESAYIDGAGPIRAFWSVMLPNARNMMLTIFLLSFTWQWTDNVVTPMYMQKLRVFANSIAQLTHASTSDPIFSSAVNQVAALLIALPILVIYLFTQRYIVQGVERSGIVG